MMMMMTISYIAERKGRSLSFKRLLYLCMIYTTRAQGCFMTSPRRMAKNNRYTRGGRDPEISPSLTDLLSAPPGIQRDLHTTSEEG